MFYTIQYQYILYDLFIYVSVLIKRGGVDSVINIAICDDSQYDIDLIKDELNKYAVKKHLQINISAFSKPELLLYELEDGRIADIFILDVSMPENDGFQLAEDIRKHTSTSVIMFLTSHEDLAINGYKSKALRYIIKLNLKRDIEEAMDSAISEIKVTEKKVITLHKYSDYWRIPYDEIISVSRVGRQLVITTKSYGEHTDNRGITEFYNTLDDKRFLFIDRSCFVNIDYLSQIIGYNLKLKNGTVLPISRRSLQNVKQTLLEQWGL